MVNSFLYLTFIVSSLTLASRLGPRQDSVEIRYHDYHADSQTSATVSCGYPWSSLTIDRIASFSLSMTNGPSCGTCVQICGAACDFFFVADRKTAAGIDITSSPIAGAVIGPGSDPTPPGSGFIAGKWTQATADKCPGYGPGAAQGQGTPSAAASIQQNPIAAPSASASPAAALVQGQEGYVAQAPVEEPAPTGTVPSGSYNQEKLNVVQSLGAGSTPTSTALPTGARPGCRGQWCGRRKHW